MRLLAIAAVVAVAGCATAYQPQSFSGGFSETRLDTNVFRVSFKGNGYTSPEKAEEMALLRSAELALNNGFTHFAVVEGRSRADLGAFTTPTQSTTTGSINTFGNTAYGRATTTTSGGQTFFISRPSTTNTIVCFVGKPDGSGVVYDARFVVDSLAPKYAPTVQRVATPQPSALQTRPMALRWDGYASLITGTVALADDGRRGNIVASLPSGDGRCTGSYEFKTTTTGEWAISCTNKLAATGTFEAFGRGKGSAGHGKDGSGNAVEFTIGEGP